MKARPINNQSQLRHIFQGKKLRYLFSLVLTSVYLFDDIYFAGTEW